MDKPTIIHPNIIKQLLILSLIVALGILLFKELYFLMNSFLGAITLYVIMRKPMRIMIEKWNWKKPLVALALMLISFIVLILPFAWATTFAVNQLMPYIKEPQKFNVVLEAINKFIKTKLNIDLMKSIDMNTIYSTGLEYVQNTLQGTMTGIGSFLFTYLILYFLITQYREWEVKARRLMPFSHKNDKKVVNEVQSMVYSNAIGIPIVAILQGLTGMIGYWIFGADKAILMGMLTAISSIVPMVGSMLVYLPLGIYTMAVGETWQGIAILVWGFAVIGSVDNVARIVLQKQFHDVHPLITLFGVFMGISIFGLMGLIFGPLLISLFLLLVKIYNDEFKNEATPASTTDAVRSV
jgi:predicted PurR-regulated permease PerM